MQNGAKGLAAFDYRDDGNDMVVPKSDLALAFAGLVVQT